MLGGALVCVLQPQDFQCEPLDRISISRAACRAGPHVPGSLLEGQLSQGDGNSCDKQGLVSMFWLIFHLWQPGSGQLDTRCCFSVLSWDDVADGASALTRLSPGLRQTVRELLCPAVLVW